MSVVEKIALGLTLLFLVVVCLRLFAAPLRLALKRRLMTSAASAYMPDASAVPSRAVSRA